jgi:hypothetical protein
MSLRVTIKCGDDMSVYYYVACLDCKEKLQLGKFFPYQEDFTTDSVFEQAQEIKNTNLELEQLVLLSNFMGVHSGHKCMFFNEEDNDSVEKTESFDVDCNFWLPTKSI